MQKFGNKLMISSLLLFNIIDRY